MLVFVTVLHVLLCAILILVILLQPGKGGDVSAALGGGSSSAVFGPRGPASLLNRATTIVAVLFMFTSVTLAVNSNKTTKGTGDALEDDIENFEEEEGAGFGVAVPTAEPPAPAADNEDGAPVEEPPVEEPPTSEDPPSDD